MRFLWFHALELIVFILAVLFLPNLKKFRLGGFALYMFVVCVTETSASNSEAFGMSDNSAIYDCYLIVSQILIMRIFLQILQYKNIQKKIYLACCFFIIAAMLLCTWLQGLETFDSYSNLVGSFSEIILAAIVIGKLFLDDEDEQSLIKSPYFWIASGTLIFNLGGLVVMGLHSYIATKQLRIHGFMLYRLFMPILIAIVYTCYGYSFILCRQLTNRLSRS